MCDQARAVTVPFTSCARNMFHAAAPMGGTADAVGWKITYFWFAFCDVAEGLMAVMLAVLFFRRRTSVPWLFVALGVLAVVTSFIGWAIPTTLLDEIEQGDFQEMISDLPRDILYLAVWGLYLLVSVRVRNTFVERRGGKGLPPMSGPPPVPGGG